MIGVESESLKLSKQLVWKRVRSNLKIRSLNGIQSLFFIENEQVNEQIKLSTAKCVEEFCIEPLGGSQLEHRQKLIKKCSLISINENSAKWKHLNGKLPGYLSGCLLRLNSAMLNRCLYKHLYKDADKIGSHDTAMSKASVRQSFCVKF